MSDIWIVCFHIGLSIVYWILVVLVVATNVFAGSWQNAAFLIGSAIFWLATLLVPGCYVPVIIAMGALLLNSFYTRRGIEGGKISTLRVVVLLAVVIAIGTGISLIAIPYVIAP